MFIKPSIQPSYFSYSNNRAGYGNVPVLTKFKGKMYPFWFSNCRLVWFPDPAWRNPLYHVYRTESPEGEFTRLTAIPISGTTYNDFTTQQSSKYANDLYAIEVIENDHVIGRSELISNGKQLGTWHQLRATEINRREWLMLSRFMGVDCILLKHVRYGKYQMRCHECWDAVNSIIRDDYCTTCYGTSYEKGYYDGIATKFQFVEHNKTDVLIEEGRMEEASVTAWTIAYPEVDVNDLVLRLCDFRVYRVDTVQNTTLLTATVRQLINLSQLPVTSVEYELFKREGVLVP